MRNTGVDKHTASHVIDAVFEAISSALADGDNVNIREFGTFSVKLRRAKTARDIGRAVSVSVPSHSVVAFKAGQALADSVYNIV